MNECSNINLVENLSDNLADKTAFKDTLVKNRVAVAMSGGVDSSVTALLLKQAGYEVIGVTGWLIKSGSRCCDTAMVDAARVCEQIGIEHHVVDLIESFKIKVMDEFPKSYLQGRTPLPCSLCNTEIKWGAIYNYSQKILKANYLSTGHYAKILVDNGEYKLCKGVDLTKDQSYVLWGVTEEQLRHTLLPLGDYTKDEIRALAKSHNLASAEREESQDLCFIPKGQTLKGYLEQFIPSNEGTIVHIATRKILGKHTGYHNFTIGQRKGLNIGYSEALYVVKLDSVNNIVYVGGKDDLFSSSLNATQCNWLENKYKNTNSFRGRAKIRYNASSQLATINVKDDNNVQVLFDEPQASITSGQVLAVYDESDNALIMGGWIV